MFRFVIFGHNLNHVQVWVYNLLGGIESASDYIFEKLKRNSCHWGFQKRKFKYIYISSKSGSLRQEKGRNQKIMYAEMKMFDDRGRLIQHFTFADKIKNTANIGLLLLMVLAAYSHVMVGDPFDRCAPALVFFFMLSGRLVVW